LMMATDEGLSPEMGVPAGSRETRMAQVKGWGVRNLIGCEEIAGAKEADGRRKADHKP